MSENNSKVLGLICARGGSKGVPGKNRRDFCGKPLIGWSVEVALSCPLIDDIVVSTDDQELAEIAKNHGAEVPFIRPQELAQDNSKQIDAIAHAVSYLKDLGRDYDTVCLLQPTCPLRIADDITGAIQMKCNTGSDTVISVTAEEGVVLSTYYELDNSGEARLKFPAPKEGTLRQDYNPIYRRCGVLYILSVADILSGSLYGKKVSAYVIPKERAFDIDTPFDWDLTEMLMQKRLREGAVV